MGEYQDIRRPELPLIEVILYSIIQTMFLHGICIIIHSKVISYYGYTYNNTTIIYILFSNEYSFEG